MTQNEGIELLRAIDRSLLKGLMNDRSRMSPEKRRQFWAMMHESAQMASDGMIGLYDMPAAEVFTEGSQDQQFIFIGLVGQASLATLVTLSGSLELLVPATRFMLADTDSAELPVRSNASVEMVRMLFTATTAAMGYVIGSHSEVARSAAHYLNPDQSYESGAPRLAVPVELPVELPDELYWHLAMLVEISRLGERMSCAHAVAEAWRQEIADSARVEEKMSQAAALMVEVMDEAKAQRGHA